MICSVNVKFTLKNSRNSGQAPLSAGNGLPALTMADQESEMNKMNEFTTAELVEELKRRQGGDVRTAEPYEELTVFVNGPAIVLIVTD